MFNYVVLILTLHKFSLSFERTLFPPPSSIWERAENQPWGKIKNSYPFVFLCLDLCLTDIWIFLGHSTDAVWLKHWVTSTDLVQCEPGPLISKIQSIKTHNIHSFWFDWKLSLCHISWHVSLLDLMESWKWGGEPQHGNIVTTSFPCSPLCMPELRCSACQEQEKCTFE